MFETALIVLVVLGATFALVDRRSERRRDGAARKKRNQYPGLED